ncbi:restriction endonuclease subunit S [Vibrio rotiferianus]|uniref:Restriction endonuclease subunit S n=1 Tax=Vibrio rotiferianus TaxID=190895 RepID=A0ABX3DAL5_9VIBR|nr:restriction endonuclease subunit S [Vibrio rotiferianus]OHY94120.1 restriction endonuclease subunit S [Vibrio rotiferianus]
MSVEKKEPEIRFKRFSGEWKQHNLGELIDIRSAARVHKEQWTETGVPFFRTSDVVSIYKGQENAKAFISYDVYKELTGKIGKVSSGDLLVTGGGSIGIPFLVPNDNPLYFKDADLLWFKNDQKFDGYFLYTFLFSETFKKYIKSISHIGTIAHYTIEQAKSTPINNCERAEQTAIGNTFQKLDNLIKQHQQKHDKLSNIKKAMLNKMFPKQGETIPEIRFKGFSGEWEEKELGSIAQLTMGQSPSGENYTNNPNDFILVQGNADLKNGLVVPRVWTSEATKKAVKGALIFSVRAPVGEVGKTNYDVVLGRGVAAVYGNEFIYQQLQKLKSDNYWHKVSAGSTFDAISSTELASTLIWISSESEQEKIGNYFQKLDALINQHQQQITKLNNIKQACLSKMFV